MDHGKVDDGVYGQVLSPSEGAEHVDIYPGDAQIRASLLSDQARAIHAMYRRGSKQNRSLRYVLAESKRLVTPADPELVKALLALPGIYTVEISEDGHNVVAIARKYEDSADLEVHVADCLAPYMA